MATLRKSPTKGQPSQTLEVDKQSDASRFDEVYVFRLRRHSKDSNFRGLWELVKLNTKASEQVPIEKMISDADNLNIDLENLQGELENDGF